MKRLIKFLNSSVAYIAVIFISVFCIFKYLYFDLEKNFNMTTIWSFKDQLVVTIYFAYFTIYFSDKFTVFVKKRSTFQIFLNLNVLFILWELIVLILNEKISKTYIFIFQWLDISTFLVLILEMVRMRNIENTFVPSNVPELDKSQSAVYIIYRALKRGVSMYPMYLKLLKIEIMRTINLFNIKIIGTIDFTFNIINVIFNLELMLKKITSQKFHEIFLKCYFSYPKQFWKSGIERNNEIVTISIKRRNKIVTIKPAIYTLEKTDIVEIYKIYLIYMIHIVGENLKEITTIIVKKILEERENYAELLINTVDAFYTLYLTIISSSIPFKEKEKLVWYYVINFLRGVGKVFLELEEVFSEKETINIPGYIMSVLKNIEEDARKKGFYKIAKELAKTQEVLKNW